MGRCSYCPGKPRICTRQTRELSHSFKRIAGNQISPEPGLLIQTKILFMKKEFLHYILIATTVISLVACKKKEFTDRGLNESNLYASFTLTTVNANNYIAKVKDSSYILSKWDFGNSSGPAVGPATQPIFL